MEIRKFFRELKADISTLTNPIQREDQSAHDKRVKSVALRILGVALIVAGALSITAAVLSFIGFAPVVAVGWATIGVAAIVFGHDLIKVGKNMRENLDALKAHEALLGAQRAQAAPDAPIQPIIGADVLERLEHEESDGDFAQYVAFLAASERYKEDLEQYKNALQQSAAVQQQPVEQKNVLEGSWILNPVHSRYQKLKQEVEAREAAKQAAVAAQ